ncbi:MAG: hypothetical protein IKQ09_04250 [Bacteroidales bacterium]|nr:hypothetical protein [Bacteroidales bacterium]
MKRIVISIALVLALSSCANAQKDGFFTSWDDVGNGLDCTGIEMPAVPGGHGGSGDVPAPLGTGLLILTALGAGYMLSKKENK